MINEIFQIDGRRQDLNELSYLNKIDEDKTPITTTPLCNSEPHTTTHLFNCTNINTQLKVTHICGRLPWRLGNCWLNGGPPVRYMRGIPSAVERRNGCWTPPPLSAEGWGRQQQQDLRESLQSVVRCSVAMGSRLIKWKMLRQSEL